MDSVIAVHSYFSLELVENYLFTAPSKIIIYFKKLADGVLSKSLYNR